MLQIYTVLLVNPLQTIHMLSVIIISLSEVMRFRKIIMKLFCIVKLILNVKIYKGCVCFFAAGMEDKSNGSVDSKKYSLLEFFFFFF